MDAAFQQQACMTFTETEGWLQGQSLGCSTGQRAQLQDPWLSSDLQPMSSACWILNVLGIGVPFFPHIVPFRTGMTVVVFLGLPSHSLEAGFTGLQRDRIFPR